jgi:hypothetical protein
LLKLLLKLLAYAAYAALLILVILYIGVIIKYSAIYAESDPFANLYRKASKVLRRGVCGCG